MTHIYTPQLTLLQRICKYLNIFEYFTFHLWRLAFLGLIAIFSYLATALYSDNSYINMLWCSRIANVSHLGLGFRPSLLPAYLQHTRD